MQKTKAEAIRYKWFDGDFIDRNVANLLYKGIMTVKTKAIVCVENRFSIFAPPKVGQSLTENVFDRRIRPKHLILKV